MVEKFRFEVFGQAKDGRDESRQCTATKKSNIGQQNKRRPHPAHLLKETNPTNEVPLSRRERILRRFTKQARVRETIAFSFCAIDPASPLDQVRNQTFRSGLAQVLFRNSCILPT